VGDDRPFILPSDLKLSYSAHKAEIDAAARRVLESGWYIGGEEVAAFEEAFAAFVGTRAAIGVASGTDALHLALRVCGVGPGDVVLTVSHTAVATVAAIELAGASAALVDIDPTTFAMEPARVRDAVAALRRQGTGEVKAVIPVHLYGHPADMPAIIEAAQANDLLVIEDCSQAHGASIEGREVGSWGDMGAFSFYPTKNLGAIGDAGALVTNREELADRARLLREYGWAERYISHFPGMNTRLDPIQAAVLGAKLQFLRAENARRREIAARYDEALAGGCLELPAAAGNVYHVYHQYVVRHDRRDDLRSFLRERDIGSLIHYPVPVHAQPAYRRRVLLPAGDLAVSESVCRRILSLPIHGQMTDEHVDRVVTATREWMASTG
jgi:dTDP-4-amino-4,6-dideoxygalactose transaminase